MGIRDSKGDLVPWPSEDIYRGNLAEDLRRWGALSWRLRFVKISRNWRVSEAKQFQVTRGLKKYLNTMILIDIHTLNEWELYFIKSLRMSSSG